MIRRRVLLAVLVLGSSGLAATPPDDERRAVVRWVESRRDAILDELGAFLALPNDGLDRAAMHANVDHVRALLERRGLEVTLLENEGVPWVLARLEPEELPAAGRAPVILFYCHIDGQAVDESRWTVGRPYEPTLVGSADDPDARLYARSASDDKSPVIGLLAALDALRSLDLPTTVEVRLLLDPEEEIGSPHVREVLSRHREALRADMMIFADGPVHQSLRPTVVFGVRGIVTVQLTVYGPARPLHSGHYGNWAPNPAEKLARLLASMKDSDGRVLIPGFYDDVTPLSPRERRAMAAIPAVEPGLQDDLSIARPDRVGATLAEAITRPSLNVRGMAAAWVGAASRTIVPSTATAELDLRLVQGVEPAAQVARLRRHVAAQGFHVVAAEPDAATLRRHPSVVRLTHGPGVPAVRTSMETAASRALIEAVRRGSAVEPVLLPTLGGTVPLHPFQEMLDLPIYGLPIVNPDNNQHAPDENLRLGNLWDGIVVFASVLRLRPFGDS